MSPIVWEERMIYWLSVPRTVIYAPRRSGKTSAIIKLFESNPHRFRIITRNFSMVEVLRNRIHSNMSFIRTRINSITDPYITTNPEDFLLLDELLFSNSFDYLRYMKMKNLIQISDFSSIATPVSSYRINEIEDYADNIIRFSIRDIGSSFIEEKLRGKIPEPKSSKFRKCYLPEELFEI